MSRSALAVRSSLFLVGAGLSLVAGGGCAGLVGADFDVRAADGGGTPSASGDGAEAGAAIDVPPPEPSEDGKCSAGRKLCDDLCVSVQDPAYGCGLESCAPCSIAHGAATCAAGACAIGSCNAGRADCDGRIDTGCEVDVTSAPDHCGTCTKTCTNAQVCSEGACALSCAGGLSNCNGACVDVGSDPAHCGTCDRACPTPPTHGTRSCNAGSCAVTCEDGYGICPATGPASCVKLDTFYRDLDNDGYGGTTTTKACAMPAGYVGLSGDCHDGNPNVHPNQTNEFEVPYVVEGSTLKSFDYDCTGAEETSETARSCDHVDARCSSPSHNGQECVEPTSATGRPAGANLTCGGMSYTCTMNFNGSMDWDSDNIRRACR